MAELISRHELLARLADVSHATWVLQGVRDYGRSFSDPSGPPVHANEDEGREDILAAEELLAGVLKGGSLRDLSTNQRHWASAHDEERAEMTLRELERLRVLPGD